MPPALITTAICVASAGAAAGCCSLLPVDPCGEAIDLAAFGTLAARGWRGQRLTAQPFSRFLQVAHKAG
jgi:hypothetical protein